MEQDRRRSFFSWCDDRGGFDAFRNQPLYYPISNPLVSFGISIICSEGSYYQIFKKEMLCIVLFGLLGLGVYLGSGREEVIRIVVFAAAFKNLDWKKVLRAVFLPHWQVVSY